MSSPDLEGGRAGLDMVITSLTTYQIGTNEKNCPFLLYTKAYLIFCILICEIISTIFFVHSRFSIVNLADLYKYKYKKLQGNIKTHRQ